MSVPPTVALYWLPLALGALGVLYGMIGFWVRGYDNYDRACILAASAYLVYLRHTQLVKTPDRPRPRLGWALVLFGVLAYLPPWFVFTQIGPRPVILWWETLALLIATAGMILIRSGPRLLYAVRFMLIFPVFALPLPGRVLNPLNEFMQGISADLGAAILPWIGVAIEQKIGNHIQLRNGTGIEVAEMCSGVVLVRTTLALGALLAHLGGFGAFRSMILLGLTVPVIILVNAIRVAAFGTLQDAGLQDWVDPGTKHEIIGYLAFIPGLLVVILVVNWLKPKDTPTPETVAEPPVPSRPWSNAALGTLAVAGILAFLATLAPGVGKSVGGDLRFDGFPMTLGRWQAFNDALDPEPLKLARQRHMERIRGVLTSNAELNRDYLTSSGDKINLWLFYWQSSMVVKDYHHPDVCNMMQGFDTLHAETIPMRTPEGRLIPVTYREIQRDGQAALVLYWTQEGRRLWGAADEAKARSFLFPVFWTQERMLQGQRVEGESDDRLQMYMSLPLMKYRSKESQKTMMLEFAGRVADEVYTRFPWADPGRTP